MLHRVETELNHNLAQALGLLGINEIQLRNNQSEKIGFVSPRDHAIALFAYLNMAGYLSESLLKKAVEYLAIAKRFNCDEYTVFSDLNNVCVLSNRQGYFDADYFISNFAKQSYFTVDDIIDLIVFLQQTAFDRQYGVERDRLQATPWMETHAIAFKEAAIKLGVVTPLPPQKNQYPATGIMGAASMRVKKRLEYFNELKIDCDFVWALSGNRELSKGLDEEDVMEKVANCVGKPVYFVKKAVGVDTREFLDGITETMMVNYLVQSVCPHKKIGILDSAIESGHWRATTAQNATDIAPIIINKIQSQEIKSVENGRYYFLIIAEQPYAGRMAKQVQREFTKALHKAGLDGKVMVEVEGCGPGISDTELMNNQVLTRLNSELGALMAERFNDARLMMRQRSDLTLRDPNIIMFSKRDETYKTLVAQAKLRPFNY